MFPRHINDEHLQINIHLKDAEIVSKIVLLSQIMERDYHKMAPRSIYSWVMLLWCRFLEWRDGVYAETTQRAYARRDTALTFYQRHYEQIQRERHFLEHLLVARQSQADRGDWPPDAA